MLLVVKTPLVWLDLCGGNRVISNTHMIPYSVRLRLYRSAHIICLEAT